MNNVIVIGAGFGGIAAALRARAQGCEVTVIDKAPYAGGRAQRFIRGGYKHDAGPTVITAPFLFDELFSLFNKERSDYVEFVALSTWYQFVYDDGSIFNYGGDADTIDSAIKQLSPGDLAGYYDLVEASEKIYKLGFEALADQPFHNFLNMIKILPDMLRLGSHRSVWQLVCKFITSDKLRQALSISPLLVGGNPFDTTSIYSLIHYLERAHGIHFAMGGTQALVDALVKLMEEEGIHLYLSAEVSNVLLDKKNITGVKLKDGRTFSCDYCISNMDPLHLYRKIIPNQSNWLAKLRSRWAKPSMGLFVLFFGSTRTYHNVEHHSIILGKDFKGLLDDIFNDQTLSKDISIYLHRPTATDTSFAPEGCDSFYALVPVPNLQASIDWKVHSETLQDLIFQRLDQTILPGIENSAEHVFCMTPEDFKTNYNSEYGAGFSIAPLFYQSAWFRFHNQGEGLNNLFLTGAGTHPGAGLPGVVSSAKVVEKLLIKKLSSIDNEPVNDFSSI